VLLCLVVSSYAGLPLDFPGGITFLSHLAGGGGLYLLRAAVALSFVLALTPSVLVALVYAWTRRPPAASRGAD
jgi:hypothetical protein